MLETKRLKLAAFEKDDIEQMSRWDESPDVRKFFFANAYILPEVEREKEMYDSWLEELEKGVFCIYKVLLKKGTNGKRTRRSQSDSQVGTRRVTCRGGMSCGSISVKGSCLVRGWERRLSRCSRNRCSNLMRRTR